MKTRNVDRFRAKDFMKRAEELKNSMERAYETGEWNSCVINAIHCAISAADALCVFKKGMRSAGDSHTDAVAFFLSIDPADAQIKNAAQHLYSLISIKTAAEYGDRLLSRNDSDSAMKHATRLFDFVKSKLPP
ncbi:MAG: HEPN domain-containing protein [Candidatus Micrarchaeota archaeon]